MSLRVLLIDDDPDFRALAGRWLGDRSVWSRPPSVEIAGNYKRGARALNRGDWDLAIVDYELDDPQCGLGLVRQAASLRRGPVVMISSTADETIAEQAMADGATDCLPKQHLNAPLLRRVLHNALAREQRLNALIAEREALAQAVYVDPLTGLPNRSAVMHRLVRCYGEAEKRGRPGAVLYLDLNKFKPVNDTYGHAAGDAVLREVANRIIKQLRRSDMVGRLGGDEFLVVLADDPARHCRDAAEALAGRLLRSLKLPYRVPLPNSPARTVVRLSASIGGAMFPDNGADADAVIRAADLAMYAAKRNRHQHLVWHADIEPGEVAGSR